MKKFTKFLMITGIVMLTTITFAGCFNFPNSPPQVSGFWQSGNYLLWDDIDMELEENVSLTYLVELKTGMITRSYEVEDAQICFLTQPTPGAIINVRAKTTRTTGNSFFSISGKPASYIWQ